MAKQLKRVKKIIAAITSKEIKKVNKELVSLFDDAFHTRYGDDVNITVTFAQTMFDAGIDGQTAFAVINGVFTLDYGFAVAQKKIDGLATAPYANGDTPETILKKLRESLAANGTQNLGETIQALPLHHDTKKLHDKEFESAFSNIRYQTPYLKQAIRRIAKDVMHNYEKQALDYVNQYIESKTKLLAKENDILLEITNVGIQFAITTDVKLKIIIAFTSKQNETEKISGDAPDDLFPVEMSNDADICQSTVARSIESYLPQLCEKFCQTLNVAMLAPEEEKAFRKQITAIQNASETGWKGIIPKVSLPVKYYIFRDKGNMLYLAPEMMKGKPKNCVTFPGNAIDTVNHLILKRRKKGPANILEFEGFCRAVGREYQAFQLQHKMTTKPAITFQYDRTQNAITTYTVEGNKVSPFPDKDEGTLYQRVQKIFKEALVVWKMWDAQHKKDAETLGKLTETHIALLRRVLDGSPNWSAAIHESINDNVHTSREATNRYLDDMTKLYINRNGQRVPLIVAKTKYGDYGDYSIYLPGPSTNKTFVNSLTPRPFDIGDLKLMKPDYRIEWLAEYVSKPLKNADKWEVISAVESLGPTNLARFAKTDAGTAFFASLTGADAQYTQFLLETTPGCKTLAKKLGTENNESKGKYPPKQKKTSTPDR